MPEFDKMVATVPVDTPWTAADALAWGSMTVQTWAEQNTTSTEAQKLIGLLVEGVLSVEPQDVSLLYLLWYSGCRSAH